ncbi:MAG: hypothetical protein ACOH1Y_17230 [Propionicimonas sp.]
MSALYAARVAECDKMQPGYRKAWNQLAKNLLKHGGELVCPPGEPEAHLALLLGDLQVWAGPVDMFEGRANGCHANCAGLWLDGWAQTIATGYALSNDGLWRQHTWCFDEQGLVETTEARDKYVGVELTDVDTLRFVAANADNPDRFTRALLAGGQATQIASANPHWRNP